MSRLPGKIAIVTGGASGIGEGTVRLFVAEGAKVVIGDVLESQGQRLAAELGDAATYVRQDVTQEQDWENAIAASTRGSTRGRNTG